MHLSMFSKSQAVEGQLPGTPLGAHALSLALAPNTCRFGLGTPSPLELTIILKSQCSGTCYVKPLQRLLFENVHTVEGVIGRVNVALFGRFCVRVCVCVCLSVCRCIYGSHGRVNVALFGRRCCRIHRCKVRKRVASGKGLLVI